MPEDLSKLPLKSLELPTKTVGKLKPLALKTVADLYATPLERLVELGLLQRELEEIAEAAPDFGVTWRSKADVAKAFGPASPAPAKKKAAAGAKPSAAAKPSATKPLPEDLKAALADASAALLTAADIDALAPHVDETGRNFQTPPPSARLLRLVRRMRMFRDRSIGGAERWYLAAVVDVSQIPPERIDEAPTFLHHVANLVSDALKRAGVDQMAQQLQGSAGIFALSARTQPIAARIVEMHHARFDAEPIHLGPLGPLLLIAAAGMLSANLFAETIALTPALVKDESDIALDIACRAWLGAARASDGLAALRKRLAADRITFVPTLLNGARLAATALDPDLAISLLKRAFALDSSPELRSETLDDPLFERMHPAPRFVALFRGYPAFEKRLRR